FDPFLDVLHVGRPRSLFGRGKIVPHAGAADVEPKLKRPPLEVVEKRVARWLGIAGKEIARRIDGVKILLGAVFEQFYEGHSLAAHLGVIVERFAERIGIQTRLELRSGESRDRSLGRCLGRAGGDSRACDSAKRQSADAPNET